MIYMGVGGEIFVLIFADYFLDYVDPYDLKLFCWMDSVYKSVQRVTVFLPSEFQDGLCKVRGKDSGQFVCVKDMAIYMNYCWMKVILHTAIFTGVEEMSGLSLS